MSDPVEDQPIGTVRRGRDFSVDEAAYLLREGVYLPDYSIELIADAWFRNYMHAVGREREL